MTLQVRDAANGRLAPANIGTSIILQRTLGCPYFQKAFGWCVPIGGLAGLIGLGGGEFRLPVLMHAIGFDVRSAIPINLMISFVTLAFAIVARSHVEFNALDPYLPAMFGLIGGGMVSALYGAGLVQRLTFSSPR